MGLPEHFSVTLDPERRRLGLQIGAVTFWLEINQAEDLARELFRRATAARHLPAPTPPAGE